MSQQTTINKLDKDNTSYRCCPSCGGVGKPAMLVHMYECIRCGMVYYGYGIDNPDLHQKEETVKTKSNSSNNKSVKTKISIKFEPRDIWVGCYWKVVSHKVVSRTDMNRGELITYYKWENTLTLYVCLIPMLSIILSFPPRYKEIT